MKQGTFFLLTVVLFSFCRQKTGAGHRPGGSPGSADAGSSGPAIYKLHLDPPRGAKYAYRIISSSDFDMEVYGKKVNNKSKSSVGVIYSIDKDSSGDFLIHMVYDKISLYSRTGEKETDLDADRAEDSGDPVERLLSNLKGKPITAVMSPKGELKATRGYDEIKQGLMSAFLPDDVYARATAEKQWDQRIKEGLIRKNMEQLFRIFPDSVVRPGDKWKSVSIQHDEVNLHLDNEYTLEDISDGIAIISCKGTVTSDSSAGNSMGYSFTASLSGTQEGEYRIETATGMLLSSEMLSKVSGEMTVSGATNVPVVIESRVKLEGRRE